MWQSQGFYNQYVLRTPLLLTGSEAVRGLYNYPAAKIAVIHGKSFHDQELLAATFGKKSIRFLERSWRGEPNFADLFATVQELENYRPDTIIAVGGGSVIDGSKLCRLLYEFPSFNPTETKITGDLLKTNFIAVPTTVGSGAEISSAAVFVNPKTKSKEMVVMHELRPEVIVYDERYVAKTPQRILVASSLDAMAHIVEGYVSLVANSFMDILAEKGLHIMHRELANLLTDETSVNYERLQYAGYLGGIVQNHCIVGAAHAIAHQLTVYGYSHGEAVALLLPEVLSLNGEDASVASKYNRLAHSADFTDENELKSFVGRIMERVNIGEDREKLKKLLQGLVLQKNFGEQVRNDRGGKGNPVPITDEYLEKLAERM